MKEPENKVKSGKYIEIIDLIDTKYKRTFLDEKMDRTGAIGGLLKNQPIICGGYSSSGGGKVFEHECILLGKSKKYELSRLIMGVSSVVMNQTRLWMIGGCEEKDERSSEFISLDQPPTKGPELPISLSQNPMLEMDSGIVYIIGGYQPMISNQTWIVDPGKNFEMTTGPSLNMARIEHCVAKMEIGGKVFIVVAGGQCDPSDIPSDDDDEFFFDPDYCDYAAEDFPDPGLTSVELLDTSSPNQAWTYGKSDHLKLGI